MVQAGGAWAADKTLDLRVLVISTGSASTDPGLDLMDDVLNEIGVPYDVLDSSTQVLTPGQLSAGDHGFYNGVILTNSELFLPDGSGSGFNFLEWQTLHDFERDFAVRESVLSGFPATNPSLGLDYGMTDIIAGSNFQGVWQAPAGGTEIFEYVNEASPLPITDFAFAGRPFVVYAGEPRDTGIGPHVQPLLVWQTDTQKTFVSHIRYDDGREVLYSSISNAWFLIHSQVLAYEFLNFATKGVFIGSREVYLETHVDDLFLDNELWDPAANVTDPNNAYRLSAADLTNAAAAQTALRTAHPTAADFTIDFPFNGRGAVPSYNKIPDAVLASEADTWLDQNDPYRNFGDWKDGYVRVRAGDDSRTLIRFDLSALPAREAESATLTLYTDGSDQINAKVCAVTSSWDEGRGSTSGATWKQRKSYVPWAAQGGDYDASTCIPTRLLNDKFVTVDVSPIVTGWLTGTTQNQGFVIVGTSTGTGTVRLREEDYSSKRPSLKVKFAPVLIGDPGGDEIDQQEALLPSVADTHLRQESPNTNFGKDYEGDVKMRSGDTRHALLRFDLSSLSPRPVDAAMLQVYTDGSDRINAKACRATAAWTEGPSWTSQHATWANATTGTPWATPGGDYDEASCVPFRFQNEEFVKVDITDIVNAWLSGTAPNSGIVVVPTSSGSGEISMREDSQSKRPSLRIGLAPLSAAADTHVRQSSPTYNFGDDGTGYVRVRSGDKKNAFFRFDLSGLRARPAETATLSLWTEGSDRINAVVCRATASWSERYATWYKRDSGNSWAASGGDYDPASCLPFRFLNEATLKVDVTPIVNVWLSGEQPNHGFVIVGTSSGIASIAMRESSYSSKRPSLTITYPPGSFDELTTAVVQNKAQFRFINHTYTHRDLDAGAGATHEIALGEIDQNRAVWSALGLPEKAENDSIVVTGEHSGLRNRMGDGDPANDVDYPAGLNPALLQAAQDLGVRFLASDASYPSQAAEQIVPGYDVMLLPRYPTAIFFNTTNPAQNTDEYNYVFHERFVNAGQDPCVIPGAICTPRTYEQILAAEAETTLRHMLGYRKWPHFFHQSNLRNYDGAGATLLTDWLDAVLDRYEALMVLPVRSLPYHEIGRLSEQRLHARTAGLRGTLDVATNTVTLVSDSAATMPVTGLTGGSLYGGQSIVSVTFGTTPQSFAVERALGQ